MTSIVFSNNSPENLERFLQSAQTNNINSLKFSVLYSSEDSNKAGYMIVFEKYGIDSHKEIGSFKEDLISLIGVSNGLVGFFKDTNYFFSDMKNIDVEELMKDDNIFCFSLILGKNIKHCYYNDVYNILLNEESIDENSFKWNWTKHYLDFGRPLELGGGHFFHKKEISKFFKKWNYENLQELESSFDQLDYYPKEMMASLNSSILIDVLNNTNELEKLKDLDSSKIDRIVLEI
jgi:hypothetical protein